MYHLSLGLPRPAFKIKTIDMIMNKLKAEHNAISDIWVGAQF